MDATSLTPKKVYTTLSVQLPRMDSSPQLSLNVSSFRNKSKVSLSKPDSPLSKAKSISHFDVVNMIEDFNDKQQLGRAIASVFSVKDRLQIVDLILKRREEIEEAQYQIRLHKAAPTLRKLTNNIWTRIKKNPNINHNLQNTSTPDEPNSAKLRKNSPRVTTKVPSIIRQGSKKFSGVEHKVHIGEKVEEQAIKVQKLAKSQSQPQGVSFPSTLTHIESQPPIENNQVDSPRKDIPDGQNSTKNKKTIQKKLTLLLSKKTFDDNKSGWSITFDKEKLKKEQEAIGADENGNKSPKQTKKRLTGTTYNIAKTTFANDLYKYLIKHQNEDEYNSIVMSPPQSKGSIIRDLEKEAKTRFVMLKDNKKPIMRSAANSFRMSANASPISTPINVPLTPKRMKNPNINISEPPSIIKEAKEKPEETNEVGLSDDSFISYTEIKLNDLYRRTKIVSKGLKLIDDKLEHSQTNIKRQTLEKSRRNQLDELKRDAGEIIKLTQRKLFDKR